MHGSHSLYADMARRAPARNPAPSDASWEDVTIAEDAVRRRIPPCPWALVFDTGCLAAAVTLLLAPADIWGPFAATLIALLLSRIMGPVARGAQPRCTTRPLSAAVGLLAWLAPAALTALAAGGAWGELTWPMAAWAGVGIGLTWGVLQWSADSLYTAGMHNAGRRWAVSRERSAFDDTLRRPLALRAMAELGFTGRVEVGCLRADLGLSDGDMAQLLWLLESRRLVVTHRLPLDGSGRLWVRATPLGRRLLGDHLAALDREAMWCTGSRRP